jgi:hypothetical protein
VCRVAISPRAALVQSLLVPGLGQWKLYRPKAAAIFAAVEIGSIGMVIKSKHDLDVATSARRDTTDAGVPKNQNLADRVKARRTHLEDWIAMIVFNHLFSGADAWVAANLVDFDVNVNTTSLGREVQVAARIAW